MAHRLFSYGTLRQPEVQLALFGRTVPTVADALPGHLVDDYRRTAVTLESGVQAWVHLGHVEQ